MTDRAPEGNRLDGDETSIPGVVNDEPVSRRIAVTPDGADEFVGLPPYGFDQRLFGGHLLGQAVTAAAATVEDPLRVPVSLHCYFLSTGRPAEPLRYSVTRLRDGRSFSARVVTVTQQQRPVMTCQLLFNADNPDPATIQGVAVPPVPEPDELTPLHDRGDEPGAPAIGFKNIPRAHWWTGSRPFDIRLIDGPVAQRRFWFRVPGEDVPDRVLQRAVLAYLSDRSLPAAVVLGREGTKSPAQYNTASLDHALWIHQDSPVGEWLLYDQTSPFSSPHTGIARGHIFNIRRQLVATVTQQGLFTPRTEA